MTSVNVKRSIFYGGMVFYITATYAILIFDDEDTLNFFVREDRLFENLTWVALFLAACLFLLGFLFARKPENQHNHPRLTRMGYLGLAALFFFGAGEEISWGQQVFKIDTPKSLMQVNEQNELTVHNLKWLESDSALLSMDTMFTFFILIYTLGLPVLYAVYAPLRRYLDRSLPIAHWSLGVLSVFNFLSAKIAKLIFVDTYEHSKISLEQAAQEIKECNYALIMLIVAAYIIVVVQRRNTESRVD